MARIESLSLIQDDDGYSITAIAVAIDVNQLAGLQMGLLRCYISRVENGHTVPTVETLEKMARAPEVPLYRLFYDRDAPPKLEISRSKRQPMRSPGKLWEGRAVGLEPAKLLGRAQERDRKLLLAFVQKLPSESKLTCKS